MTKTAHLARLINGSDHPLSVTIEPIARSVQVAPGETVDVFDRIDGDLPAEIAVTEAGVTLWLNLEASLVHAGQTIKNHPFDEDDAPSLASLQAAMRRLFATRGGATGTDRDPK
jgi:hypothetical protein